MSTITVPMPEEDLEFLRSYMSAQGMSAEAFLARQARNLREHLQRPLHRDIEDSSGIIAAEVSGEDAHRVHIETKHS